MHVKNSKTNEAPKTKPVIQAAASTIPSNKEEVGDKKKPAIPEKNKGPFANTTANKKPTTKNPKVVEQNRPTKKPVTNASIPTKKVTALNETTKPAASASRKSIRAGQL